MCWLPKRAEWRRFCISSLLAPLFLLRLRGRCGGARSLPCDSRRLVCLSWRSRQDVENGAVVRHFDLELFNDSFSVAGLYKSGNGVHQLHVLLFELLDLSGQICCLFALRNSCFLGWYFVSQKLPFVIGDTRDLQRLHPAGDLPFWLWEELVDCCWLSPSSTTLTSSLEIGVVIKQIGYLLCGCSGQWIRYDRILFPVASLRNFFNFVKGLLMLLGAFIMSSNCLVWFRALLMG